MHEIQRTAYGIRIDIDGYVDDEEMAEFAQAVESALRAVETEFSVLADMRGTTLSDAASRQLSESMAATARRGFERAAVIIDSPILDLQQDQLEADAGIDSGRRVVDAREVTAPEDVALAWVRDGTEIPA